MPWSKSYLPKEIASEKVLEFVPQKIDLGTPETAKQYVQRKPGSDFRMNEQVQIHTGVDQIEKASDEERSERRALEMMAEMQENAYQEAYQLGLDDGRKKAFDENSLMIEKKMGELDDLLKRIATMKEQILSQNETHMVKLLFHMAARVAMKELSQDEKSIVDVIRSAVSLAQEEEDVRIQLSPDQIDFIETLKKQTGREIEFLKKIRFEPNPEIQPGGCVVETNYGEIDSRVETRIAQIWDSIVDTLPRVKDRITG
ncbi:MAG: flagellar assembly protein [Bdellovibrionaceae bacterium]|nr:flagellar assembly protein [Pseudobdellovibrionaceae bacterium]